MAPFPLTYRWQAGTALYILGLIGYQGALTFWTAAFPGLARDMPHVQASELSLARGEVSQKEHDTVDMLTRNRLANVSFFVCSVGEIVVLAILAGILMGIIREGDTESNTRALSVVCAYSAGVWSEFLCCFRAICVQDRRRSGAPENPGTDGYQCVAEGRIREQERRVQALG